MQIILYIGLLDRLLTDIKPCIESTVNHVNTLALTKITLEIEKLEKIELAQDLDAIKNLIRLYNVLYEKTGFYYKDYNSDIRREYVRDSFQQIRALLMELIIRDENSGLRL